MDAKKLWAPGPEWINEARQHTRWQDVRTVMTAVDGEEFLGKTRDISLGGASIALLEARPSPVSALEVKLVFEQQILSIRGQVVYTRPARWGSLVGVAWAEGFDSPLDFLQARYGDDSGDGKVK